MSDDRRGIATGTPVPRIDREVRQPATLVTYRMTPDEIDTYLADKYGIKRGEKSVNNQPAVTMQQYLEIRRRGVTRWDAAKELGIGPSSFRGLLISWGIWEEAKERAALNPPSESPAPATAKKFKDADRRAKYLELRANGISKLDAFTALGIKNGSIHYFLTKWELIDTEEVEIAKVRDAIGTKTAPTQVAATTEPETDEMTNTAEEPTKPVTTSTELQTPASPKPFRKEVTFTVVLEEKILQSAFEAIVEDVHQTAVEHGWHETSVPLPTQIALIHSEVSEALEADRKNEGTDKVSEELADVIIRVMDTAAAHSLDLSGALFRKMAKNRDREYRHGGRKY